MEAMLCVSILASTKLSMTYLIVGGGLNVEQNILWNGLSMFTQFSVE